MIFADKIIKLRKKIGWTQEELAEQMNVTRQSVSKWEGAQSIPDLDKILRLSELFGVSTDYLLKDSIEEEEVYDYAEELPRIRRVSMEEASEYISIKEKTAKSIAYATFLCILSPICMLVLGGMSETGVYNISERASVGIGMIVLLSMVTAAVAIFISVGSKTDSFKYLEKEIFETEYGVCGMVDERKERYKNAYTRNNIIGVCLCILASVPIFIIVMIESEDNFYLSILLSSTLILVGIGVIFFIRSGVIWESFEKLLQEGDYSKHKKEANEKTGTISMAYWLTVTAIYLGYSFITNNWKTSWIIWVVSGIMYPVILAISNALTKKNRQN